MPCCAASHTAVLCCISPRSRRSLHGALPCYAVLHQAALQLSRPSYASATRQHAPTPGVAAPLTRTPPAPCLLPSQCGSQQQLRRALELVAEMRSRGVQCNVHTYSALMNVCIKGAALRCMAWGNVWCARHRWLRRGLGDSSHGPASGAPPGDHPAAWLTASPSLPPLAPFAPRQRAGPGAGCVPPDAGRGLHPQPGHLQHPHRRLRQDRPVGGSHPVSGGRGLAGRRRAGDAARAVCQPGRPLVASRAIRFFHHSPAARRHASAHGAHLTILCPPPPPAL